MPMSSASERHLSVDEDQLIAAVSTIMRNDHTDSTSTSKDIHERLLRDAQWAHVTAAQAKKACSKAKKQASKQPQCNVPHAPAVPAPAARTVITAPAEPQRYEGDVLFADDNRVAPLEQSHRVVPDLLN
eukprot:4361458-Prymnesium_polylepis.1